MSRPRFALIPAAYVYLRRGDEVLLQLRQGTGYLDGTWAAGAAGHIEFVEHATMAAIREAREELGITLEEHDLTPLSVMQRTDGTSTEIEQRVDWFFAASTWVGDPRIMEPSKCARIDWFSLQDLPEAMPPHERLILESLADGSLPAFTNFGF
ncbi:DNA mismatch repair protein MutT [Microbacterium sp. CH12i]|uniref:NUDIX hydrolase n=1 Tax=Microbacterium sp. CH12i TaxID=1479651 RepID=UPI0004619E5C|nr:NUDIX domain-containing protein [Microbacterium sp. CH12i]KDA04843.1 DNA mismatch repair protein MutT [Microbacterium sp. CH12i]